MAIDLDISVILSTALWVALIAGLLAYNRRRVARFVEILLGRIEAGSSFSVGPVQIGEPPAALVRGASKSTAEGEQGVEAAASAREHLTGGHTPDDGVPEVFTQDIFLVHTARALETTTEDGRRGISSGCGSRRKQRR